MEKIGNKQKSIESAKKLLILLEWIKCECPLNSDEQEGVHGDIQSINNIVQLLDQAQTKQDIRTVWNYYRDIHRNLGGYVTDRIGRKLYLANEKLWKNLLNTLADSQDVNNPNPS